MGDRVNESHKDLSNELWQHVFTFLSVQEYFSVLLTCRRFRDLVLSTTVLRRLSFEGYYPESATLAFFQKASEAGNFEASVKVGLAGLYGIAGVPASSLLSVEGLVQACRFSFQNSAHVWTLIRPPWAAITCRKASVLEKLEEIGKQRISRNVGLGDAVMIDIGQVHHLLDVLVDHPSNETDAASYWKVAAANGNSFATGLLVKKLGVVVHGDLSCMYTKFAVIEADLHPKQTTSRLKREVVEVGCRERFCAPLTQLHIRASMRSILVDWLFEVKTENCYTRNTFYSCVRLVDLYLRCRQVARVNLQLIGVTAMLLASRMEETDMMNIREACWLTENSYSQENIVRMIGEIFSALHGQLWGPTPLQYVRLFIQVSKVNRFTMELMHCISESLVVHLPLFSTTSPMAAAAVFVLTMMSMENDVLWPKSLQDLTGFKLSGILPLVCTFKRELYRSVRNDRRRCMVERTYRGLVADSAKFAEAMHNLTEDDLGHTPFSKERTLQTFTFT